MQSKTRQEQQQAMLRHMRPDQAALAAQQNFQMMRMQQPNGGMPGMNPMGMKPGQNPLPRTAMANSQNK